MYRYLPSTYTSLNAYYLVLESTYKISLCLKRGEREQPHTNRSNVTIRGTLWKKMTIIMMKNLYDEYLLCLLPTTYLI